MQVGKNRRKRTERGGEIKEEKERGSSASVSSLICASVKGRTTTKQKENEATRLRANQEAEKRKHFKEKQERSKK